MTAPHKGDILEIGVTNHEPESDITAFPTARLQDAVERLLSTVVLIWHHDNDLVHDLGVIPQDKETEECRQS